MAVFLHEVELDNSETLSLVTTPGISAEDAAEFYSRRYDVEHDIRDLKEQFRNNIRIFLR